MHLPMLAKYQIRKLNCMMHVLILPPPLSSPAPSIASFLANLTIDTSDYEELHSEDADIIPDSIVREIGESIYENVPLLSAIPSLPATPITPIKINCTSVSISSKMFIFVFFFSKKT